MENEMNFSVDISQMSNLIWNTADRTLRGMLRPEKYKDIIIPMVLIRRFECKLENTKEAVLEFFNDNKDENGKLVGSDAYILENNITKVGFYNTSKYSLGNMLLGDGDIWYKFEDYLDGFSKDISEIIRNLNFKQNAQSFYHKNEERFRAIIKEFATYDLGDKVSNAQMGYLFEDLIRRFSENAEAGDHYTPREVIALMCELGINEVKRQEYMENQRLLRIYDGTCGTGGMLVTAKECLHRLNENLDIQLFGQEINSESFAIAKADMLINNFKGDIHLGNTLTNDLVQSDMDLVLMNPPFGVNWDVDSVEVELEHKRGFNGRFGAGLPAKSDGALLFLQHMVSKLAPARTNEDGKCFTGGRGLIVMNGSPLFSGNVGSGESNIRKWLLENDLLEGIVALPTDMFYNTGIATYIWIITNEPKEERRKGKVQLVDAREFATKMRKALGNKRNELTGDAIKEIARIYHAFEENEYSKIYDNEEFMYYKVDINLPFQRNFMISEERIQNVLSTSAFNNLYDEGKYLELLNKSKKTATDLKKIKEYESGRLVQEEIISRLTDEISDDVFKYKSQFESLIKGMMNGLGLKPALMKAIILALSEQDDTVPLTYVKGKVEYDSELKDTETIKCIKGEGQVVKTIEGTPLYENQIKSINEYLTREVEPHMPNAQVDISTLRVGAEIPFTRLFYKYENQGSFEEYMKECKSLEVEIDKLLGEVFKW